MKQRKGTSRKKEVIMNEKIRSKEVRLIDEQGEQGGIVLTADALKRAIDADLDLVLISPNSDVPVAKIIDYGKYSYELQKKQKENKSNQKQILLKEVRVSPTIDIGDYNTKMAQARKFLAKGHKVQFSLRFKGRMITHSEFGRKTMNRILEDLKDEVVVEQYPKMDGRKMFLIVSPVKK